jgi:Uma2 family endonuclease
MKTVKPRLTFEEYLEYDDETDNRYELVNGELFALPPESELNDAIANYLFLVLANAGIPFRLIKPHTCEIQVSGLQKGDPQNRFPDLVVLREEHLPLTQKRLTIKLDMPPPQLVAEVVSPGQKNRERDYDRKRTQYAHRGIPEYWMIDPGNQVVIVLKLASDQYVEIGQFRGDDRLLSNMFPTLQLTAEQVLKAGE